MDDAGQNELKKKRKYTKYASPEDRKAAERKRKAEYDRTRVNVGSEWENWERMRLEDGFNSQSDWIKHLLAVHECRCEFRLAVWKIPNEF